jgi:heme-degrading monooxygenase HmoA
VNVRLSSTVVAVSELNLYTEHVQRTEITRYEKAPGLISVWVLQRPFVAYVELLTISLWESEQAIALFATTEPPGDQVKSHCSALRLDARAYELVLFREGKARGERVEGCEAQEKQSPPG